MTVDSSSLTFVPWVAAGIGAALTDAVGTTNYPTALNRAPIDLTIAIHSTANANDPAGSVTPKLEMLGPGDVIGLPSVHVLRTEPHDGAVGVETTIFPSVELDLPELPWLFTAGQPHGAQMQPWLRLVVVAASEGVQFDTGNRLLVLPADLAATELPPSGEAWAWTHAQYTGSLAIDDAGHLPTGRAVAGALADPTVALARLVCPRVLEPSTHYYACIVPTTTVGQRAALGASVGDNDAIVYDWFTEVGAATITLPVYYSFEFTTGVGGDFKSLALKLAHQPDFTVPNGGEIGVREITVALPTAPPGGTVGITLPMPTIITAPPPPLPPNQPSPAAWLQGEFTPNLAVPQLTVPAYGAVQAGLSTAELAQGGTALPPWLTTISTDPTLRVAASLGSSIVTSEREQLVASAFLQLGDIRSVNLHLSRAQNARVIANRQVARHLTGHDAVTTLQLLGPLASRLPVSGAASSGGPGSALSALASPDVDPLLLSIASAAHRRVTRPTGPHARNVPQPLFPQPPATVTPTTLLAPVTASGTAVTTRVLQEHLTEPTAALAAGNYDQLRALAPAVQMPTPMLNVLYAYAPDVVLYGASDIPLNTAVVLQDNPRVITAFMVGLNHALERLLQWRDVPTDRRATPFRWFWSTAKPVIDPIAEWPNTQTLDGVAGAPSAVLVVRSELFIRYPRTAVYAVKAATTGPRFHVPEAGDPSMVAATFTGQLPPDLRLFVFDGIPLQPNIPPGTTDGATVAAELAAWYAELIGYFFVFQEQVSETRFGTDMLRVPGATADPLPASNGTHWTVGDVEAAATAAGTPVAIGDAALMADTTRMPPAVVAINAATLLPPAPSTP